MGVLIVIGIKRYDLSFGLMSFLQISTSESSTIFDKYSFYELTILTGIVTIIFLAVGVWLNWRSLKNSNQLKYAQIIREFDYDLFLRREKGFLEMTKKRMHFSRN